MGEAKIDHDYLLALLAVTVAARDLADEIERRRPLDGPWTSDAFNEIHRMQDRLIAELDKVDSFVKAG